MWTILNSSADTAFTEPFPFQSALCFHFEVINTYRPLVSAYLSSFSFHSSSLHHTWTKWCSCEVQLVQNTVLVWNRAWNFCGGSCKGLHVTCSNPSGNLIQLPVLLPCKLQWCYGTMRNINFKPILLFNSLHISMSRRNSMRFLFRNYCAVFCHSATRMCTDGW